MYIPKITYYILSVATAFALASGLTSCTENDDELIPETENTKESEYYVSFYLDTSSGTTRSTDSNDETNPIDWDNLEEVEGEGYENYIDPHKLAFYLYNPSTRWGSTLESVNWAWCWYDNELKLSTDLVLKTTNGYYVQGKLTGTSVGTGFQLAVYANIDSLYLDNHAKVTTSNCSSYYSQDPTTSLYWLTKRSEWVYSYASGYEPSAETPIPMFGIKNVPAYSTNPANPLDNTSGYKFLKGKETFIGTINLMRAMAKIEVYGDNVDISSVKIAECYDSGYPAPYLKLINRNWDPNNYWNKSSQSSAPSELTVATDDYINIPGDHTGSYLPSQPSRLTNVPFTKCTDEEGKTYYRLYLPEYRIKGSGNVASNAENKITLTINDEDYDVKFKDYSSTSTTYFNILRNHIYRYHVSLTPGARIQLNYEVLPWDEKTADDIIFE